jgi:predicted lipoprotein
MQVFFFQKHLLFLNMKKYTLLFISYTLLFLNHCSTDLEEIIETDIITPSNEVTEPVNNSNNTSSQNTTTTTSFDHKGMLINWADNIIIPAITDFQNSLIQLQETANTFTNDPAVENLTSLREICLTSYSKWQYVEMFDIGVAEEIYFKNRMNLYPVNTGKVEDNISNQNYDLEISSNFSSQGFSTIDYLLFGIDDNDDNIISKYSDANLNYGTYLSDIVDKMVDLTNQVKAQWESSYREYFIESIDNTATSSINLIVNDFIFYFEKGYRANKFGIPAGVFSGNPLPDRIESYYGEKYSKILALEAGNAIDQFFNGKNYLDSSEVGLSLNQYLDYLEDDDENKLSEKINNQLKIAKDKILELNDNFKTQIEDNNNQMLATYDAIQKTVVLLKVDMLQKLNISVDYADADGD